MTYTESKRRAKVGEYVKPIYIMCDTQIYGRILPVTSVDEKGVRVDLEDGSFYTVKHEDYLVVEGYRPAMSNAQFLLTVIALSIIALMIIALSIFK
ncbi:MAG TPA: hypothetical protein PKL77_06145 [Candidatus Omnitrophota bacterium]|nr:hypothetical protein [Candidatus Omnitrophota bacterium]